MTWTEAAPAALEATAVLFLPGVVVGWAAGWRGIAVWGSAPLLSVGIIAAAAMLAPVVGLRWSLMPVAVLSGPALWPDQRAAQYPGLELLDEAEGFELVERRGETRLYRIAVCAGEPDVRTAPAMTR